MKFSKFKCKSFQINPSNWTRNLCVKICNKLSPEIVSKKILLNLKQTDKPPSLKAFYMLDEFMEESLKKNWQQGCGCCTSRQSTSIQVNTN